MSETTTLPHSNPLTALGRFIFWFSLIAAAIAVYYFFLFERGSEHVYRRDLRSLTQIERQINTSLSSFKRVASTQAFTASENSEIAGGKDQQIGGHTYHLDIEPAPKSSACITLRDPASLTDMQLKVNSLGGNASLDFYIKPEKNTGCVIAQKIPLANFINAGEALEQFHQILVFDNARNLIYRSVDDSDDLIKANVYDLLAQNVTTHEAFVAIPDGWLRDDDDKTSGKLSKTADKKDNADNSSAGLIPFSKVRQFKIGEQEYLAFIRPMKLNYATTDQPGNVPTWYVVGITTASEFNASRFVIPRWWMAIFILALALFVLSTPYIKLRLLGPRDLIRSSTISLTTVSMLFATMITTIMLLNLFAYLRAETDIHEQLRASSKLLEHAFTEELTKKLKALDTVVAEGPAFSGTPFTRSAVFDSDADLYAIWSLEDNKISSFSVKGRNFWQQLTQRPDILPDQSALNYSLENFSNSIDGRKTTVCAKRISTPPDQITDKPGWKFIAKDKTKSAKEFTSEKNFSIVTGLFKFSTFTRALLPKGYGFIVIDNNSGAVQYHSETGTDLIEYLYEETDNNPALKTAINTGSPDTFLTNYRGYRYLFHTRPLTYSHWTLITYFSQELLDRANIGLLLAATGLGIGFLLIYLGGGLLGFKFLSNTKINLLWPNPAQARGYRVLLILLSVLAFVVLAATTKLHADQLFAIIAMAPLAALSGSYICLIRRYQPFQSLIANHDRDDKEQPLRARLILKDCFALAIAASLIFYALYWAMNNAGAASLFDFVAHGRGFFIALCLLIVAHTILLVGLRSSSAENHNFSADWRRGFLHLLLLLACATLMENLPYQLSACVAATLIVVLTQPLWSRGTALANRYRCKFYFPIDRRSDRGQAYVLHRACVTLLIVILAILPAVAFYRDATSLYSLRWKQQDAQKLRADIEHLLQAGGNNSQKNNCDLKCRVNAIIDESRNYGLLATDKTSAFGAGQTQFTAAPALSWQLTRDNDHKRNSAETDLMQPTTELSHSLARIAGFSKIENNAEDDAQFSSWNIIRDASGQHLRGAIKFNYTDGWLELYWQDYFEFGFLRQYRIWILLALALFATAVVYPMVRLILRELVAEADLRPYPALTTTELDLLLKNYRNTLLLVSAHSLEQGVLNKTTLDTVELERNTASTLRSQLVNAHDCPREALIAALPEKLNANHVAPDIMVVSEQRWNDLASQQSLQQTVRTRVKDTNPPTWEALLESINKLRYPDDLPDLALDHWKLDRTCTLLICRNIEAQTTLAQYAAQHGWSPQTLGKDISGEKIWLHNIEEIIFEPSLRKQLLTLLESLQTHEASRSIVLTSLILPHLWLAEKSSLTEKSSWHTEELSARELTRWLAVLTRINVRTVNALTIEQNMSEINRSYHALPRPSREAEYALWWRYSTADERTALAALTHEGLINPFNRSVIRSLMARGLIFRGSTLRFCDKAFRLFVKHKYPITQLRRQADIELQQSSWGAARGPLLITLAVFGYGVMVMGGGAFESILGLATSIGASIPALLNLARLVKRDGSSA